MSRSLRTAPVIAVVLAAATALACSSDSPLAPTWEAPGVAFSHYLGHTTTIVVDNNVPGDKGTVCPPSFDLVLTDKGTIDSDRNGDGYVCTNTVPAEKR